MHQVCPVSGQSPQEEYINHLTSLIGFILSVIGTFILMYYSFISGDHLIIFSNVIYALSLLLMYGASSFYHGCKTATLKSTLRIVDHSCIYLLIAGTYTPIALGPLRGDEGWPLFWIEWGIACAGIIFKFYHVHRFKVFSTLAYLAMGWLVVFSLHSMLDKLQLSTLIWIFAGGLSYTVGSIFFLWRSFPWHHGVWHLFVLGGSICHYFAILSIT